MNDIYNVIHALQLLLLQTHKCFVQVCLYKEGATGVSDLLDCCRESSKEVPYNFWGPKGPLHIDK